MLGDIRNLILDMDGVLWRGETPMPGLADFFATLRRLEYGFVLATNNATKTAVQYQAKLARFGVDIPPAQILTSAETTASFLRRDYAAGTAVYVIGDVGLRDALTAEEFDIIGPQDVLDGRTADLVVVGFTRHAVYDEFAMATLLIDGGARFIGTNPDPTYPSEIGHLPGAGALQAVLVSATGVEPTIIGKPSRIIFDEAVRRLNGTRDNTAMVGDRLNTDIAGARTAGLQTILLLSGVTTRAAADNGEIRPDFIFDDINDLARHLE